MPTDLPMISRYPVINRLFEMHRLLLVCCQMTETILQETGLPDEDHLQGFLNYRAELLTRIRDIDEGLARDANRDRIAFLEVAAEDESKVADLIVEINKLFAELIETDQAVRSRMEKELGDIGQELTRVRQGLNTLKAYRPPAFENRLGLDRRS